MTADRTLFALAAVAGGVGAGATVWMTPSSSAWTALRSTWDASFSADPWRLMPLGASILIGAAALATVTDIIARRVRPEGGGRRIEGQGRTEIVAHVRAEVERMLKRKEPNAVAACDALISGAVKLHASDLHLSPTPEGVNATYRVEGDLVDVVRLTADVYPLIVTRLKVLSKLDTYIKTAPQDGRLIVPIDGASIEARVSTLPTEMGERVVLRFVRGNREVPELNALGFAPVVEKGLAQMLARPQGLVFVTGPVGSGKTTTLYSALQYIAKTRGRSTTQVTLEDPIELELPFATQTQIHPKPGMTFATALRSVLRQDPNVLMVGEIRDRETAEIAMQAGLTGHLILTTVHGLSAAGVFARLIEMDVEPFLLSSAVAGALSQRLVRMLCAVCRKVAPADPSAAVRFRVGGVHLPDAPFFEAVGCDACDGHGFTGRLPIGELLVLSEEIGAAIKERAPTSEIERIATNAGMTTLLADGLSRALRGETTLAEVLRVAG